MRVKAPSHLLSLVVAAVLMSALLSVWSSGPDGGPFGEDHADHLHNHTQDVALLAARLPRAGWTVTASSQETVGENGAAGNVIDGDAGSIWHTRWTDPVAPLPHTLTIDMKTESTVAGLEYLPRPSGNPNGAIGQYRVEVSTNGTAWGTPVATGTFADDAAQKAVKFTAVRARYVRLTALSEAGGRGPWASAAEIHVLDDTAPPPPPAGVLPRTGWTVTSSSEETAGENGAAGNVLDGDVGSFWHSRWTDPVAPLPHTLTIDMKAETTVAGLRYLPRPGSSQNGTIGQYRVELSGNGTAWGSPVATGTFADDASEKTATFPGAAARYVRLTALTEAGNRGPWAAAAEINLLGGSVAPVQGVGRWSAPTGFPIVPVAAATLPNGKVLTWSAYLADNFGGSNGRTQTAVLDPATGSVSQREVSNTGHDMFCPGTAMLADGRVLVNGGSNSDKTSLYTASSNSWATSSNLAVPRGYQSAVTLSDGRVFTLGGSWSGNVGGKYGEVWSPGGGSTPLTGARIEPSLTADPEGPYRADNHAWLFAWKNNRVFQAGPSRAMNWYGVSGTGSVTAAGTRGDDGDAMNGNAIMYEPGKILTVGGAPAYQNSDATRNAFVVDINGAAPVVRKVGSMASARAFHNSVVLPDGKVMVAGGQARPVPFSDDTAALTPELWDPATETFTPMASNTIPRTYHSVGILLPDARVMVGGGGLCGGCSTNHFDAEIFTPPYLLNADGTARTRPTITSAPTTATAGNTISVTTGQAVTRYSLVRMSSVTHTVNTDQRRIPLTPSSRTGNTVRLPLPSDRGVLVPGFYMLFALDAAGVPSVSRTIRIS